MDTSSVAPPGEKDQPPSTDKTGTDGSSRGVPALARAPQQARSRRTLRKIRHAAWSLLDAGGSDALTVTGVAAQAGVSVGSFYARFEGKDELLEHLAAVAQEEALEHWRAARSQPDPPPGTSAAPPGAPDVEEADGSVASAGLAEGASPHTPDATADMAGLRRLLMALVAMYNGGPGSQLQALARIDPAARQRQTALFRALVEDLVPALEAAGLEGDLVTAVALAAAARELGSALGSGPDGWSLGLRASEPPQAVLVETLLRLARASGPALGDGISNPEGARPQAADRSSAEQEPRPPYVAAPGPAAAPPPVEPPGPVQPPRDPSEELFDVWG